MIIDKVRYLAGLRQIFTEEELQRDPDDDVWDVCFTENLMHFYDVNYTSSGNYEFFVENFYRVRSHIFVISLCLDGKLLDKRKITFSITSGVKFEIIYEEMPDLNVAIKSHACTLSAHPGYFKIDDNFLDTGDTMIEFDDNILHFSMVEFVSGYAQHIILPESPKVLCMSFKLVNNIKKEINVAKLAAILYGKSEDVLVVWDNRA